MWENTRDTVLRTQNPIEDIVALIKQPVTSATVRSPGHDKPAVQGVVDLWLPAAACMCWVRRRLKAAPRPPVWAVVLTTRTHTYSVGVTEKDLSAFERLGSLEGAVTLWLLKRKAKVISPASDGLVDSGQLDSTPPNFQPSITRTAIVLASKFGGLNSRAIRSFIATETRCQKLSLLFLPAPSLMGRLRDWRDLTIPPALR